MVSQIFPHLTARDSNILMKNSIWSACFQGIRITCVQKVGQSINSIRMQNSYMPSASKDAFSRLVKKQFKFHL